MNVLKANIINELQKLFLKRKILVLFILVAAACFIPAFFITSIQTRLVYLSLSSMSFPLMVLSVFTNVFLPLFIFMAAAELFAGEVGSKSLKLVLLRPISRFKVFASKNIALSVYIIINLLVVFVVSILSCIVLNEVAILQNISHITFAYFIDIIPAIILAVFSTFLVQFFRTSSASLIACVLLYMVIRILSLFISSINNALFTSYLNWYSIWHISGAGSLRSINLLFMLLAYGIIFFTLGYYLFDKKEVW